MLEACIDVFNEYFARSFTDYSTLYLANLSSPFQKQALNYYKNGMNFTHLTMTERAFAHFV